METGGLANGTVRLHCNAAVAVFAYCDALANSLCGCINPRMITMVFSHVKAKDVRSCGITVSRHTKCVSVFSNLLCYQVHLVIEVILRLALAIIFNPPASSFSIIVPPITFDFAAACIVCAVAFIAAVQVNVFGRA